MNVITPKSLQHVLPITEMPDIFSYVEPFGGSATVLAHRYQSSLETFNDLDDNVVILFRSLRNNFDKTIKAIAKSKIGPKELTICSKASKNEIEQARRFYTMTAGIGGHEDWTDESSVMSLIDRLRRVQIECIPPLRCIRDFDTENTMFYVRPKSNDGPKTKMLAHVLNSIKGNAAFHAPVSDLHENLYQGWHRHERTPSDCVWTNYKPMSAKTLFSGV